MDTKRVFRRLDEELQKQSLTREIVICGGAALVSRGYVGRQTGDVDSMKLLDGELRDIADRLAPELALKPGWLNSAVRSLADDLPAGWEVRSEVIYQGKNLTVKSLCRADLILSKLYAAVDRGDDIADLVEMGVTDEEICAAEAWVLEKDASEIWPELVRQCVAALKKELTRG